jgi:hypothetical protein
LRRFSGEIVRPVDEALVEIDNPLCNRNAIDGKIARMITQRMTAGHLSDSIASRMSDMQRERVSRSRRRRATGGAVRQRDDSINHRPGQHRGQMSIAA